MFYTLIEMFVYKLLLEFHKIRDITKKQIKKQKKFRTGATPDVIQRRNAGRRHKRRNICEAKLSGVKLPPAGSDVTQFICVTVERKAADTGENKKICRRVLPGRDPDEKNQSILGIQPKRIK
jgi:hypothetical protein